MIHHHVHDADRRSRPRHQVGEVVLADIGNWLEGGGVSTLKSRPIILLRIEEGQHYAAGLTTQPRYLTTGVPRRLLPHCPLMGLGSPSYLWSEKAVRVCRINVRMHLGWIDRRVVEFLAEAMPVAVRGFTLDSLLASAHAHDLSAE